jgi:transposase-like protein
VAYRCRIRAMSQHFLLSRAAKTLTLAQVMRLSNDEAEKLFARIRWHQTNGAPVCPRCGGQALYDVRRPKGPARWRCKACNKEFTITSGTLFAWRKMPVQSYLAAIAIFTNEVKGKAALALSRDLGTAYKTAFVLAHKLREAMASEMKGATVGGAGKIVETDGAYFGGYVRPANLRENRVDRRLASNKSGKRKVVVVVREREGKALPAVFRSESAALGWINSRVAKDTKLMADEAPSWNDLHARYDVARIDHGQAYAIGSTYTNNAESFFSRLRRGEIGHHHHVAGPYLIRYSQESAWRENNRRVANGEQTNRTVQLALSCKPSVDFCGYWQRHKVAEAD